MQSRHYKVIDEAGLHARPASLLVREASKHEAPIFIEYNGKKHTLKSIMIVMSLGIGFDKEFSLSVDSQDADTVLDALEAVLKEHHIIH